MEVSSACYDYALLKMEVRGHLTLVNELIDGQLSFSEES